jgi:hypothetical protein
VKHRAAFGSAEIDGDATHPCNGHTPPPHGHRLVNALLLAASQNHLRPGLGDG